MQARNSHWLWNVGPKTGISVAPQKKGWCPAKKKKNSLFYFSFRTLFSFNISPLISLFWTSGDFSLGFQSQCGSLTCVLCCLLIMDSSHSPLVRHLQTSVAHLPVQALMGVELVPHWADRRYNRMRFCASVSMAIHCKDTWFKQSSHLDWKNGKVFSSQRKVREFWTDWKSQGQWHKILENTGKFREFQNNIVCYF